MIATRWLLFLLSTVLLSAEPLPEKTSLTAEELQKTVTSLAPDLVDATIGIFMGGAGSGSGVIVSPDGLCISAAHVTSSPGNKVTVLLSDGRELEALTLGVDHGTDGSLLQITEGGPFPYRPYIREKNYQIGDWVIVTGHPGGPIVNRPPPLRLGQISAAGEESGFKDPIVTDAIVISGDSGGPLFNLKGEVIGINSNVGMPWRANQHVPIPSIVAKWDDLLASKTFGAEDNALQTAYLFDDPYRQLRETFLQHLSERPEHPLARRPRLLSPNEMQAYLDDWEVDPGKETRPYLGIRLSLANREIALISEVAPGSPAAEAGLKAGHIITAFNETHISSAQDFALAFSKLEDDAPLILELNGSQKLTIKPSVTPRRQLFPMPLAGLINMRINDSATGQTPDSVTVSRKQLIETIPTQNDSWVTLFRGEELIVHGTAVAPDEILTKLSELGDLSNLSSLTVKSGKDTSTLSLISKDTEYDVALLKVSDMELTPVSFRLREPRVGTLVFTPTESTLILGCMTQPFRESPKAGYEHAHTPSSSTGWLGISFSPSDTDLIIAAVEIGSPADRAGFLEGDEIVDFAGEAIETRDAFAKKITPRAPGEKITLLVRRNTEEVKLSPILEERPPALKGVYLQQSAMTDKALSSLSGKGGPLSKRRLGFPFAFYHDQIITPQQAGSPLFDLKGRCLGINIARSYRHRSLAIPAKAIDQLLWQLQN